MSITAAAAANAYGALAKAAKASPEAEAQTGFAQALQDVMASVVEAGKSTDQIASQAITGKADMVDVVTAVAETELALETLVSVRDRVISAYEEIMRMPI